MKFCCLPMISLCLLVEFRWCLCFQNARLEFSESSCASPSGPTTTQRTPNVHFGSKDTIEIQREDRESTKRVISGGRRKKRAKFWAPPFGFSSFRVSLLLLVLLFVQLVAACAFFFLCCCLCAKKSLFVLSLSSRSCLKCWNLPKCTFGVLCASPGRFSCWLCAAFGPPTVEPPPLPL